jgi:hypothetical protein
VLKKCPGRPGQDYTQQFVFVAVFPACHRTVGDPKNSRPSFRTVRTVSEQLPRGLCVVDVMNIRIEHILGQEENTRKNNINYMPLIDKRKKIPACGIL